MKIKTIQMQNFRCFQDASITLHPRFTLIVGNNGSGKSSVLDAAAIGLGCFFLGINGIPTRSIHQDEVRYETFELGDDSKREGQYPASIVCTGIVQGNKIDWTRSLSGGGNRTTHRGANKILKISREVSQNVMKGNMDTILPVIAYYGTGHLWAKRRERIKTMPSSMSSRFTGYTDCLDSKSNMKRMYKWFAKMTFQSFQEGKPVPLLEAVQNALLVCFNGKQNKNNLGVAEKIYFSARTGTIEIEYRDNHGKRETHPLDQMSDGYQNMLSIVGDIAYRMAMLNPQLRGKTLEQTPGVVLIDEIDMHLHPSWQQHVINDLCSIFPNVQFIATTHAPSVISSIAKENIIVLKDKQVFYLPRNTYGKDANTILREVMGVSERLVSVKDLIDKFYLQIDERQFNDAKETLAQMKDILSDDDADIAGAEVALKLETLE